MQDRFLFISNEFYENGNFWIECSAHCSGHFHEHFGTFQSIKICRWPSRKERKEGIVGKFASVNFFVKTFLMQSSTCVFMRFLYPTLKTAALVVFWFNSKAPYNYSCACWSIRWILHSDFSGVKATSAQTLQSKCCILFLSFRSLFALVLLHTGWAQNRFLSGITSVML